MSGTRLTSPVALMSSRVPAIGWAMAVTAWAMAAAGRAAPASASAANRDLRMIVILS